MKKTLRFIIVLLFAFAFTACAGSNNIPNTETTDNQVTTPAAADDNTQTDPAQETDAPINNANGFVLDYDGTKLYMDENMADVLQKLGEPRKTFEAPSCAFDGIDKIYSYPGLEIHTYPKNDNDYVHTINFKDDSVTTPDGICLGSTLADVLAAYGDTYTQELGLYTYAKGQTNLSFLIEDDEVVSITYGLVM